jgi:asparagine synthase (glutamine-hydrolysing)
MCGITGWVDYARDLGQQRPVPAEMVATMACRGRTPKGCGSRHMWRSVTGDYQ